MIILLDKDDFFIRAANTLKKKYNEESVDGLDGIGQLTQENYERITFLGHTHPDGTFGLEKYDAKKIANLIKEIESKCPAGTAVKAVDLIGYEVGFKKPGQEKSFAQEVADELGRIQIRAIAPPPEAQSKYFGTSVKIQTIEEVTTYKLVGYVEENNTAVEKCRETICKLTSFVKSTDTASQMAAMGVRQKIKEIKRVIKPENVPLIVDLAKKYSDLERLLEKEEKKIGSALEETYQELKNTIFKSENSNCPLLIEQLEQSIKKKNAFIRLYEKHLQDLENKQKELYQSQTVILEIKATEDLRQYLDKTPFCQFSPKLVEMKDEERLSVGKRPANSSLEDPGSIKKSRIQLSPETLKAIKNKLRLAQLALATKNNTPIDEIPAAEHSSENARTAPSSEPSSPSSFSKQAALLAKAEIVGKNIAEQISYGAAEGVMETATDMTVILHKPPSPQK